LPHARDIVRSASRWRRAEVIVILGALSGFTPLAIDMYLPALPTIGRDLGADAGAAQSTLAAFFVAFAAGQALYGPLSDHFGRKGPLYVGMGLFALASIGCALAAGIEWLMVFRALQGLGACAGGVIARAMVRDLYESNEVARTLSALMLVSSMAPMVAPLLGGFLLVRLGWPSIFWLLAGLAALSLIMLGLRLPESRAAVKDRKFRLADVAIGYWRVLADRRFIGYALAGGISSAAMFAYISASPFVFIGHFGVAPDAFGWIFGANALAMAVAAQTNARLLRRFSPGRLLLAASATQAAAGLVLLAAATANADLPGVLLPLLAFLACNGFIVPNTTALAMGPFAANAGVASAVLGTLQFAIAAGASSLAGLIHSEGATTMAAIVAACGILGLVARWLATRAN
jgi:DHA1 family bicyclomycin/chloramphenicol resistance-like MFS transporter